MHHTIDIQGNFIYNCAFTKSDKMFKYLPEIAEIYHDYVQLVIHVNSIVSQVTFYILSQIPFWNVDLYSGDTGIGKANPCTLKSNALLLKSTLV